ncbi:unnamed protein product, partial [Darwinula stevensoni]
YGAKRQKQWGMVVVVACLTNHLLLPILFLYLFTVVYSRCAEARRPAMLPDRLDAVKRQQRRGTLPRRAPLRPGFWRFVADRSVQLLYYPLYGKKALVRRFREMQRAQAGQDLFDLAVFSLFYAALLLTIDARRHGPYRRFVAGVKVMAGVRHTYGGVEGSPFRNPTEDFPFQEVRDKRHVFPFLNHSLLPALHPERLYNGAAFENGNGLVGDFASHLVSLPRIRQYRVKNDSCDVHELVKKYNLSRECKSVYSEMTEERRDFSPGWRPLPSRTPRPFRAGETAFRYQTDEELGIYSFYGGNDSSDDLVLLVESIGDDAEESSQFDYNYGWKDDSPGVEIFGGDENEKGSVLYDDKCIYSSSLLLWKKDFDFDTITTAEIRDKVTKALDDE